MTVTLGDVEAERIADMLESLSGLEPDEVPGHEYDDGMKADATMYADELRDRQGRDVDELVGHFTLVFHAGNTVYLDDGTMARYPEVLLDERVPPDATESDVRDAAREKLRREGYDPDDFSAQIDRRAGHWADAN